MFSCSSRPLRHRPLWASLDGIVTTDADKALDRARDSVKTAIDELYGVVMGKTWGHDAWRPEYKDKYRKAFNMLMEVNRDLDG